MNSTTDIAVEGRLCCLVVNILHEAYGKSWSGKPPNLEDLAGKGSILDIHVANQFGLDSMGHMEAYKILDAYDTFSVHLPSVEEVFAKAHTIGDWIRCFEALLKERVFNGLCNWMERRYVESEASDRLWHMPSKHGVRNQRALQLLGHLNWDLKDLGCMHDGVLRCLHIEGLVASKPLDKGTTIGEWANSFVDLLKAQKGMPDLDFCMLRVMRRTR